MEPHQNLLGGPAATLLPDLTEARAALEAERPTRPSVAARSPAYCAAWAALADRAWPRATR